MENTWMCAGKSATTRSRAACLPSEAHDIPPLAPLVPGEQRWVAQWGGDGQVAVQCDHAQRLYARCYAQHVCGRPELAHEVPKAPHVQQDVAGAERDHDQAHDEVCDGQRGDEQVGDGLEPLEAQNGCDHQHVTWWRRRKVM